METLPSFSLFPEQASADAHKVDQLYFFILLVCLFFSVLTAVLLLYFAVRYRKRRFDEPTPPVKHASNTMEYLWCAGLFAIFMVMFFWSATLYVTMQRPPEDALEIYVVGRQWMWKVQHPDGQREINEMHVPVGQPVKLIITSEDVIHSYYIPAFRVKQDAVPGRYSYMNFTASKPGRYHLFCAEYCGTEHSRMRGTIVAMEPSEYQEWLNSKADLSMALRGRQLFLRQQCVACHAETPSGRAPSLENLYRRRVTLKDGSTVIADEDYLRESIRRPKARIVAGYEPIMPEFDEDRLSETELQQIIAFIKTLKTGDTPARNERTPPPLPDEWKKPEGESPR
jgi:cytochrome c oxidase subunit II